jgi:hypothetical protein
VNFSSFSDSLVNYSDSLVNFSDSLVGLVNFSDFMSFRDFSD